MSDYTRKPKTPKGGWKQVATGFSHTVALKADGSIACWGYNEYGQCSVPAGLGTVQSVAAGGFHSVALKADGTIACWGRNDYGQCSVPAGLGTVQSVAAGFEHTVALKADGSVACWGWNQDGQCNVPSGLGSVQLVAAGFKHTVALKADGSVACWGNISTIRTVPWDLSDETWFDLVADYGDKFYFKRVIPDRIRRTEKYKDMMLLMKL